MSDFWRVALHATSDASLLPRVDNEEAVATFYLRTREYARVPRSSSPNVSCRAAVVLSLAESPDISISSLDSPDISSSDSLLALVVSLARRRQWADLLTAIITLDTGVPPLKLPLFHRKMLIKKVLLHPDRQACDFAGLLWFSSFFFITGDSFD